MEDGAAGGIEGPAALARSARPNGSDPDAANDAGSAATGDEVSARRRCCRSEAGEKAPASGMAAAAAATRAAAARPLRWERRISGAWLFFSLRGRVRERVSARVSDYWRICSGGGR